MFAALMFWQTSLVRSSIAVWLVTFVLFEFFHDSVLSPSVRMMITLSRSVAGAAASESGAFCVSACQPQTRPMVTFVLPFGLIRSTLAFKAVQSYDSGIKVVRLPQS